jgi:hypothetical protein
VRYNAKPGFLKNIFAKILGICVIVAFASDIIIKM